MIGLCSMVRIISFRFMIIAWLLLIALSHIFDLDEIVKPCYKEDVVHENAYTLFYRKSENKS